MLTKLLPVTLLTASCYAGATSIERTPVVGSKPCTVEAISKQADKEILPYIEEFSDDAIAYGASCLKIKDIILSDNVKVGIAGYCQPGWAVVLSTPVWKSFSAWERRTLVYHELGHCSLNAEHVAEDDLMNIMNPTVLPEWIASRHWKDLVRKLFQETPT